MLGAFAIGLREVRRRAGGTPYRTMSRLGHYSAASLAEAAAGRKLPSLGVTLAYVRACGGDVAEWEARWRQVSAALAAEAEAQVEAEAEAEEARSGPQVEAVAPATVGQLPPRVAAFTGRGGELEALADLLAPAEEKAGVHAGAGVVVVTAVAGLAGVGKTALTVQAAHAAVEAGRFPGGVLFVDLHGYDETPVGAAQALEALLRGLGTPPERVPADLDARAVLYRSRLAAHAGAVLVIADNASQAEQVRPLLPGDDRHRVVVTSRHTLASLGARLLDLAVLPEAEAVALLAAALRAADPNDSRVDADPIGAARLAERCGRLPLALQIAAALLTLDPDQTVAGLVEELADATGRLDRLDDGERGVRAAFELSHRRLTPDQAHLFARLGLHPGPEITPAIVAVLTARGEPQVRALLGQLARAHMIERAGVSGRWRLHDLIAVYAREVACELPKDERQEAFGRLLDYYLHATRAADQHLTSTARTAPAGEPAPEECVAAALPCLADRAGALAWLEAERANIHACVLHAAAAGRPAHATGIAHAAATFLAEAGHWRAALTLHQAAVEIARAVSDRHAHATALNDLGHIQDSLSEYAAAIDAYTRARRLFQQLGDERGEAMALTGLSRARRRAGEYEAANASLAEALEVFQRLGDGRGQAAALLNMGEVWYLVGQLTAAVDSFSQALELCRRLADPRGQATALLNLGTAQIYTGEHAAAVDNLTQALGLCRRLGDRQGEGNALAYLGLVQRLRGRHEAAANILNQALTLHRQLDDRNGETVALVLLGAVEHLTGQHAAAADKLTTALERFRQLGDRGGEAEVLNYYGALVATVDGPERGRTIHEQALRLSREIGARWDEANALAGIAATHHSQGDAAQAAERYRQSLTLFQELGCHGDAARIERILAEL